MGERNTQTVRELSERLPESVEAFDGIFKSNHRDATHVIIHEDEVGAFFKAVREMGLETDTIRSTQPDGKAIRGYVE